MSRPLWPTVAVSWTIVAATSAVVPAIAQEFSTPPPTSEEATVLQQINSIQQLRDVSPLDWSYEALKNLVENYGCIVGYPDRTYRGDRALTRNEFAAGLNACLQQLERRLLEARTASPASNTVTLPQNPGDSLPNVFNRAFANQTGRFYDISSLSGQANSIFGWRYGPNSFFDNQIADDALTIGTVYRDAMRQQTAGPVIRTRDLPNPFDTSLQENPQYHRFVNSSEPQVDIIIQQTPLLPY